MSEEALVNSKHSRYWGTVLLVLLTVLVVLVGYALTRLVLDWHWENRLNNERSRLVSEYEDQLKRLEEKIAQYQ